MFPHHCLHEGFISSKGVSIGEVIAWGWVRGGELLEKRPLKEREDTDLSGGATFLTVVIVVVRVRTLPG